MSMTTTTKNDLMIKADFAQASSPIMYSQDGGESWDSSTFQVADAGHDSKRAIAMVQRWLDSGN